MLSKLIIFSLFFVVSVSHSDEKKVNKLTRDVDLVKYSQGFRLYRKNCSACHGQNGEGAPHWRKVDAQGKNPAPPLNGSGHTWHHSTKSLTQTIKMGTAKLGGNMPAWKDKLSDKEIKLILTWIKAQWPDELYMAWYNRYQQKQ